MACSLRNSEPNPTDLEPSSMPRDDPAFDHNSQLLALYLRISRSPAAVDPDGAVAEVLAARHDAYPHGDPGLEAVFDRYVQLIALHLPPLQRSRLAATLDERPSATPLPAIPPAFEGHTDVLGPIRAEGRAGISLVSCSMNRSENLIKALPSWLAKGEISEVVIVDWSSRTPVADDLRDAGIADPRIRILRVDGEKRWALSYAFNAGFRGAACDLILKVDADIVLAPDFFRRNALQPGAFIAGNWRVSDESQAHVNGFFFISRKALRLAGGFNEHITSYGWDDEDLYGRLTLSGLRRQDVAAGTIQHLPHDDVERIGEAGPPEGPRTLEQELSSGTMFLIRRNRYIAMVMPHWDEASIPLPFRVTTRGDQTIGVQREGWVPSAVPAHVVAAANIHALSELAAWQFGKCVLDLGPDRIGLLLARPLGQAGVVDVQVALSAPDKVIRGAGHYLVLDLPGGVLDAPVAPPHLTSGFKRLLAAARARGLHPVLRAPYVHLPVSSPGCLRLIPMIPSWEAIGDLARCTLDDLLSDARPAPASQVIALTAAALERAALTAPAVSISRPRLFIDAQHGLGNRLRAIASAAAIAEAAERELVIVWQPDEHCAGRFRDLFDHDGAVEETRFLDTAAEQGCAVYNYMPHEPGARKDEPIRLDDATPIYARAAFVLNSPASTWELENRFLQGLTPIDAIRDLINAVRHPNDLSAHVRMEGGKAAEHLAYEKADNWRPEDHALIDEWRGKSHFSHFLRRIDTLITEGRAERIFLAADMPQTYAEFQHHYGDRLAWLPRSLYDRSTEQLHYAMADAILLSRSPLLLGSGWSSFSELAMRLAPKALAIELSGKDF